MVRLAGCWRSKEWIDVVVDIDDTLVYSPGPIDLKGVGSYRLAHGAIEFLAALDRIPLVRTSFYSAGSEVRNKLLIERVTLEAKKRGLVLKKKLRVFSVADGMYGKKGLRGLKRDLHVQRAILVDDRGRFAESGEERNLLKVYSNDVASCEDKVYKARLSNNLVRALGMILCSIRVSRKHDCGFVKALFRLQWDGQAYLHESTNARDVYEEGLQAMKDVNPSFSLLQPDASVHPWSQPGNDELFHSNIYGHPFDRL